MSGVPGASVTRNVVAVLWRDHANVTFEGNASNEKDAEESLSSSAYAIISNVQVRNNSNP